ncbi:MAG: TatD family hydrolase [Tannerellaceae bacterium]|jgi:TatD DNase family protein|nr:TatD family hydrolase [Tannerellaceae bacterium]
MMTYYNIHSHFPSHHSDEVTILNWIIRKKEEEEKGEKKAGFLSVGIHPWYIEDVAIQIKQLRDLAALPEVVAIGEAGLDRLIDTHIDIQQEIFVLQAHLAEELQKPFIIHCVKAWEELIVVKKQIKPKTAWIIHGFRGKPDLAEQLIHQGFHLSFGTYFNPGSLQIAYPDHIFAETDDKDSSVRIVYSQMASVLNITEEELGKQIQKNVKILFSI